MKSKVHTGKNKNNFKEKYPSSHMICNGTQSHWYLYRAQFDCAARKEIRVFLSGQNVFEM